MRTTWPLFDNRRKVKPPMTDYYGRVLIDGASFWIQGGPGADMMDVDGESLISGTDDFASVRAYVNGLYTGVRVVTHDAAPQLNDLDEWDQVEEVTVHFTEAPYLFVPLTERDFRVDPELRDLGLAAGRYRIRCATRGGLHTSTLLPYGPEAGPDEQDTDPASYHQQFRLDFWPDPQQLPSGSLTVLKTPHEKDEKP